MVGDYVDVPPAGPAEAPASNRVVPLIRRWLPALSLAAILVFGFFLGRLAFAPPVAQAAEYVAMDINPSLELDLSRQGTVLAATSFNADAGRVLGGLKLAGTSWEGAVAAIIARSQALGFLKAGGGNLVTVTAVPAASVKVLPVTPGRVQGYVADQLRQRRLYGSVLAGQGTSAERRQAIAKHLSLNKYLLYERAKQKHIVLPLSTVEKVPIKDLVRRTGLKLQEIYPAHRLEKVEREQGAAGGSPGAKKLRERLRERLSHHSNGRRNERKGEKPAGGSQGTVKGEGSAGSAPSPSSSSSDAVRKAKRLQARLRELQRKCLRGHKDACAKLQSRRALIDRGGVAGGAVLPAGLFPEPNNDQGGN